MSRRTVGGRQTKGAAVERVVNRNTKREGVVRLNKDTMTFWAIAGAETTSPYFESKDGREVRDWLHTALGKTTEADRLDWIPVVEVKVEAEDRYHSDDPNDRNESIKVDVERYFLALTKDEREWRKLDWPECDPESGVAIEENDRASQSHFYQRGIGHENFKPGNQPSYYGDRDKPFILPHYSKGGASVIRYTPELWFGLVAIVDQIVTMRKTIADMLGTKKGLALVAAAGSERMPLRLTATVVGSEEAHRTPDA